MDNELRYKSLLKILVVGSISFFLVGCAVSFKPTPPEEVKKAKQLKQRVEQLDTKLQKLKLRKQHEIERLKEVKRSLEQRLRKEMQAEDVKLDIREKGLVITVLDRVLFDSGKAKLKPGSYNILDKVARILKAEVPDKKVGIEGHTDNQPIKYSGWKSNWELSTARALNVLHYFEDDKGIDPERLTAIGYGPYRPVASNETPEGRQKNRRVEIVILPEISKIEEEYLKKAPPSYEDIK